MTIWVGLLLWVGALLFFLAVVGAGRREDKVHEGLLDKPLNLPSVENDDVAAQRRNPAPVRRAAPGRYVAPARRATG